MSEELSSAHFVRCSAGCARTSTCFAARPFVVAFGGKAISGRWPDAGV